jgi:Armadillo/beta-catenin-like repeat
MYTHFRRILREENCLGLLLSQLRSPSLTIVSNACGTLWNFSARNQVSLDADSDPTSENNRILIRILL